MAGISSKALAFGGPDNKYKYSGKELQSKEFSDGSGLESYDVHARIQDPQLGRFWQIDPKCELFYHYNQYNYCFNNPVLFIDPDGMQAKWNGQYGDESRYIDDGTGEEISWDEVQQQYSIGYYDETQSVLLSQPYEKEGESVKNDQKKTLANDHRWGSKALLTILNAAKSTDGNISIIQANSADDAANQIENLSFKIDNLIIASHGTTGKRDMAFFMLGDDFIRYHDIESNTALQRISKKMDYGSSVILFACGGGGFYNKGDKLVKKLAAKLNSTVYAPQGESFSTISMFGKRDASLQNTPTDAAPHLKKVQGLWTRSQPGGSVSSIKNVYFDSFGRIHYENK